MQQQGVNEIKVGLWGVVGNKGDTRYDLKKFKTHTRCSWVFIYLEKGLKRNLQYLLILHYIFTLKLGR